MRGGHTSKVARGITGVFALSVAALACTAPAEGPATASYTLTFPSTQAAVATDSVQLLVFDGPPAGQRSTYCQSLIQGRKRRDPQRPIAEGTLGNICELLQGRRSITIDYGEKAVLAIGQRGAQDFLIGCVVQTFGEGDPLLDVDLALVDVGQPVPETDCTSVSAACAKECTRR